KIEIVDLGNGGNWTVGQPVTIKWKETGLTSPIKAYLRKPNTRATDGVCYLGQANVNTGLLNFTVSGGADCISISGFGFTNKVISAGKYTLVLESGNTKVSSALSGVNVSSFPSITLNDIGNEGNWFFDQPISIKWSYTGLTNPSFSVFLQKSNAAPGDMCRLNSVEPFKSSQLDYTPKNAYGCFGNNGSTSAFPNKSLPAGEYKLIVRTVFGGKNIEAISKTITVKKAPKIFVKQPVVGEYAAGGYLTASWMTEGFTENLKIELANSAGDAVVASLLGNVLQTPSSISALIPASVTAGDYRVRISSVSNPKIFGLSNIFKIKAANTSCVTDGGSMGELGLRIKLCCAGLVQVPDDYTKAPEQRNEKTYGTCMKNYPADMWTSSSAGLQTYRWGDTLSFKWNIEKAGGSYNSVTVEIWEAPNGTSGALGNRVYIRSQINNGLFTMPAPSSFDRKAFLGKYVIRVKPNVVRNIVFQSPVFNVVSGEEIVVTTPGTTSTTPGFPIKVLWKSYPQKGNVYVNLIDSSGKNITNVMVRNNGYYVLTIPKTIKEGAYRVRVTSAEKRSLFGQSLFFFVSARG
ncbi:MAG TPA: hypothetical protein P5056_03985, partial [Candidatus Paceibacterota bacterium]|nr:hypothetical protein [Candidatus Paceibacterota bacterium]